MKNSSTGIGFYFKIRSVSGNDIRSNSGNVRQVSGNISPASGFTLMEVVVAMVLVSMVTLIAALGFRLAVRAWERGETEGNSRQISIALPFLIEKQLNAVEKNVLFAKGQNKVLPFFCNEKGLSFFTSYSPEGSLIQGLVRVTYVYDKKKKKLSVFEQAVTRLEDIDEKNDPLSDKWTAGPKPVSVIHGIDDFSVMFLRKTSGESQKKGFEDVSWLAAWGEDEKGFPMFVKLVLVPGVHGFAQKWYFRVG